MRLAIVPGSFDPMTVGHFDLIRRASLLFDRITVAVMANPQKKESGCFDFAERKKIAELSVASLPNVDVITAGGYLADLAASLGACAIVKGVRNADDYAYETKMAEFNHERNSLCETVYLPSYGGMADVSSTAARAAIANGDFSLMMPAAATYVATLAEVKNEDHDV